MALTWPKAFNYLVVGILWCFAINSIWNDAFNEAFVYALLIGVWKLKT